MWPYLHALAHILLPPCVTTITHLRTETLLDCTAVAAPYLVAGLGLADDLPWLYLFSQEIPDYE